MVLDAKALTWAAKSNIDTAKLKAAKVPIYGKWYFPEIPPGVPLINLETGEQQVFPERMVAGEVIFVPAAELLRAGLVTTDFPIKDAPTATVAAPVETPGRELRALAPEPLLAMARPVGLPRDVEIVTVDPDQGLIEDDPAALAGIQLPAASIAPFVLGIGFCLLMLGIITSPIIVVVGLLWMLAGAVGWIRIGLLEARATNVRPAEVAMSASGAALTSELRVEPAGQSAERLGVIFFIVAEVALFGTLLAQYFYVRAISTSWPVRAGLPPGFDRVSAFPVPLIAMVLLLASAFTANFALSAIRRDNRDAFQGWLIVTILLGAAFLGGLGYLYASLIGQGFNAASGIYGTVFFTLTGLHGLQVLIGVLLLIGVIVRAFMGQLSSRGYFGVEGTVLYWYLVATVSLVLYVALYAL